VDYFLQRTTAITCRKNRGTDFLKTYELGAEQQASKKPPSFCGQVDWIVGRFFEWIKF